MTKEKVRVWMFKTNNTLDQQNILLHLVKNAHRYSESSGSSCGPVNPEE